MSMNKFFQSGFTLLELMVMMAMIGVVSAIGFPSYNRMMVNSELVEVTNEMRMSLKLARSSAIVKGRNAVMCSSNGTTCSGVDGKWKEGWIVFLDMDGDDLYQKNTDELLWVYQMNSQTRLTIEPVGAGFNQFVRYSYNGWIETADGSGFDICSGLGSTDGYARREIRSSIAGEPHIFKNLSAKC